MHARATCASGKHVETFTKHFNKKANPLSFKSENDGSFTLIYLAG